MWKGFMHLLKKDFKMMLSGKFFLLALLSLILYSCYINLIYVNLEQDDYQVYLFDPHGASTRQDTPSGQNVPAEQGALSEQNVPREFSGYVTGIGSRQELENACADGVSIGIDLSADTLGIYMLSSGTQTADHYRTEWAKAILAEIMNKKAALLETADHEVEIIGAFDKEQKSRREITCEFLFFELSAVGFLGLASILFKEKQMGVIRVHGILPVHKAAFILSKLCVFLLSDLFFAILLTFINVGFGEGLAILPGILVQAGILSLVMALVGFLCAVWLPDFKQFSLFYLVLAIFVTTPVFIVGQMGVSWDWIVFHPMYHLFTAMKSAYFGVATTSFPFYFLCAGTTALLFYIAYRVLAREMTKEG